MTQYETNSRNSLKAQAGRPGIDLQRAPFAVRSPAFRPGLLTSNPRAFTLIELMISIALVLLLILGINQVFHYTTQAVGAGEAINSAIRSSRAAEGTFAGDFNAIVSPGTGLTDSGSLIISSAQAWAFHDKDDLAADRDGDVTTALLDNSGSEQSIPIYTFNFRNHRIDCLSFFARDLFHRQTGNVGTYMDDMSSPEAWIWYGHLSIPDNNGNVQGPGIGATNTTLATNPNNFFATQFVLGRLAILLREKNQDNSNGIITDNAGFPQAFINRQFSYPTGGQQAADLDPLSFYSTATDNTPFNASRYDLGATTIASFRSKLLSYISNASNRYYWWQLMMDGEPTALATTPYYRFAATPYLARPMNASGMAQASPYFLGACSQFTVEFAGDYLSQFNDPSQLNYGQLNTAINNGNTPDGQVDYLLIKDPVTLLVRKQIIWYGFPRNTSGTPGPNATGFVHQNTFPQMVNGDVAPVSAWTNGQVQSFEKNLPLTSATADPGMTSNYNSNPRYTCAWGPNDAKPKLIRITMTLDDPTGRLPDGQTYQYVFAVP